MGRSPHTPEFRAKVAQEYLDGLGSVLFLAKKYGIGKTTIQQWAAKYQLHGICAFAEKTGNTAYSQDFKLMCVEEVLAREDSVDESNVWQEHTGHSIKRKEQKAKIFRCSTQKKHGHWWREPGIK